MFEKFLNRFATYEDDDYTDFDFDYDAELETRLTPMNDMPQGASRADEPTRTPASEKGPDIVVLHPKSMDIAEEVANYVRAGRMVVCNFEDVEQRIAQRVVDFMTGAAYSLDGRVHAISDLIFLVVPSHVSLTDEYLDSESGVDFLRTLHRGR